jgi:hypothetical protein
MMAPEVYERARADAPIHIQIWRRKILWLPYQNPSVRIHGRVVRIFRDRDGVVHWGQKIELTVAIANRMLAMPGGGISHHWDSIGPGRWFEAFVETRSGYFHLVHSQIAAIRHPTLHSVCAGQEGFLCQGNL